MQHGETHINITDIFSGIKRYSYPLIMLYAHPNTLTALESMPLNSALLHYLLHMQTLSPTTANPIPLRSFSPFFMPLSTWDSGSPVFRKAKNVKSGVDSSGYSSFKAPIKSLPPTYQHQLSFTSQIPFPYHNQQCL